MVVTDQVDTGISRNSRHRVHNKHDINHSLEQETVLVMFGGQVILNDSDDFKGIQYRVCIGTNKRSADECSCW